MCARAKKKLKKTTEFDGKLLTLNITDGVRFSPNDPPFTLLVCVVFLSEALFARIEFNSATEKNPDEKRKKH